MNFEEYERYDAMGLAGLVARKDVTPTELLDVALARLSQVNGKLNAVVSLFEDDARRAIAAGLPDGPLKGVPYLVKDLGLLVKGVSMGMGSRLFKNSPPAVEDSALTTAYRAAGLILFGKTNTPEFGAAATTEPVANGATLNPWNLGRTCGGSSGGSASAVAARVVPAAHASDGGGSIRMPASCCGLFGLKPSRGRVSASPLGDSWGGFAVNHAVTRTVRDSALLLDISCRPVAGDSYWLDPPETPFVREAGREPGRLRVGFIPGALMSPGIDEPVAAAVREAARLCETLGHHVEETTIPADFEVMKAAANEIVSASITLMLQQVGERRGRAVTEDEVESVPWICFRQGSAASARQVMEAFLTVYNSTRAVASAFERYDVLLLSTLGQLPVPLGALSIAKVDPATYPDAIYRFMPNTQAFNVAGMPAMSVPLAWSDDGLPIGVQFAARAGGEATLIRLAAQLEKATPWVQRKPDDKAFVESSVR